MVAALGPEMLVDALAIRVDDPRAWGERLTLDVRFTDTEGCLRLLLANGVLAYSSAQKTDAADATLRLPFRSLAVLASGAADAATLASAVSRSQATSPCWVG